MESHRKTRAARGRAMSALLALALSVWLSPTAGAEPAAGARTEPSLAASIMARVARYRTLLVHYGPAALEGGMQPAAAARRDLRDALGAGIVVDGVDASGGVKVVLDESVTIDDARRLLNRLRARPGVVWAELDPAQFETQAMRAARQAAPRPGTQVARLIVTLSAPEAQRASRANEKPASHWSEALSRIGGSELTVTRATAGSAWIVRLAQPLDVAAATAIAERLTASGVAVAAEPDLPMATERVANDPYFVSLEQWALQAPPVGNDAGVYGIDATGAWDTTTGDPSLVVAIVDSGVLPHPEFGGRLLKGYDFVSSAAQSRDGLGRHADGSDPGNWITALDCDHSSAYASDWHGTAVAGVAAATGDNQSGIAGVNWRSRILPVRVTGLCGTTTSDVVEGLYWAAGLPVPGVPDNPDPARVINMSVGSYGSCSPQMQAALNNVLAKGAFVSVSVGNGSDLASAHQPGGSCLGVTAVSATDRHGNRASYSNFGPGIDIAAPGGDVYANAADGIVTTYNNGTTVPGAHSYAFLPGTSIAAPHVAGVASLMLSVNPSLSPAALKALIVQHATPFPASSSCLTIGCGAGILNAAAAVAAAMPVAGNPAVNYGGMWWNAPARSEDGWGINFTHQGDTVYATWFTYGFDGKPLWMVFAANRTGANTYAGDVYTGTGPAFDAVPFDPAKVIATRVGTATLVFADGDNATFSYDVSGVAQTKSITREIFASPVPTCTWGAPHDPAAATNYQGLWWNAPAGSESGWGLNLTHQGDTIFANWFTYDLAGAPLWLVFAANRTGPSAYAGEVYSATGPAFNGVPFDSAKVQAARVGSATLSFPDGATAQFGYNVNGVARTRGLVRETIVAPGTLCR